MVSYAIDVTSHNNHHFFVAKLSNISFLVKHLTNDSIFKEKLGRTSTQNNIIMSAFPNLFYSKAVHFLNGIALSQYINFVHNNWDNYNQDNDFISNTTNNNSSKSEPKNPNQLKINPNNLNKFYNIYNWLLVIFAFLTSKLLTVSAFSTSKDFLFFFSNGLPVKISAALHFRFCVFLIAFFRFFFGFSSIFLITLAAICIFLAFLSRTFLVKAFTFFISFSSFFFSIICRFAAFFELFLLAFL